MIPWVNRQNWPLLAVVALGAFLRFGAIGFGLPYIIHPDEAVTVRLALQMLHTGDFNPHFFHWPSFTIYLNAAAYLCFFLFGRAIGRFSRLSDVLLPDVEAIAVGRVDLVEEFLISRALNILAGIAAIIVVYHICRAGMIDRRAAWIAALLAAVAPTMVSISQVIHPDTFAVLFCLLAAYYAVRILDAPRVRNYVLPGIFVGLGASSKYNVGLVCFAVLIAHLLRFGWRGLMRREIYLAGLAALAAFLVTTPYSVFDFQTFRFEGPLYDVEHYSTGHAGAEGDTLNWYSNLLWNELGIFLPLALGGIALAFWRRDRRAIVLVTFPIVYFIFVAGFRVHFETTILPVIPFLAIFSARAIVYVEDGLRHHTEVPRILQAGTTLGVILFAFPLFDASSARNAEMMAPDGRAEARAWIESNLPPGTRIALEPYAPYLSRSRFTVEGFKGMIEHPPEWYVENGFEYLVFSDGSYGRFYVDPEFYPDLREQYDAFFKRFLEIARFDRNGPTIRVLKTGVINLPSVRVVTHWGIDAPWIELLGYDFVPPTLTLYWRTLQARREPLKLTARLIDRDDRMVSQSTQALFSLTRPSGKWLDGIARETLRFEPAPEPGLYRLELEVNTEGLGQVPVLFPDDQTMWDKPFVQSLKVPVSRIETEELKRVKPLNVQFGDGIALLGYALRTESLERLVLYWQSQVQPQKNYTVFVHLLDSSGQIRAQIDREPRKGAYPTAAWDVGEIIPDEYELPWDVAPGDYTIELGLYEFPSLQRLPILDAGGTLLVDHLILPDVVKVRK